MTKNPYLRKCGMADFEGICSIATFVMRSKDENVLTQEYLAVIMQTDDLWNYLEANKSGSVNYFITWKTLEKYEFELPDIETQKKIAKIAWQFEKTHNTYEEMLTNIDELIKSEFIEMFGDPVENPMRWSVCYLGDCLETIENGKSLNCETFARTGNLPAVLKLSAVTYGEYNPFENKQLPSADMFISKVEVKKGDLLFSRKNTYEYVGMTAVVKDTPSGLMLPDLIFRLVTKPECHRVYLSQLINHPLFRPLIRDLASGSTGSMPNISKQRLSALRIPLPPEEVQAAFEVIVEQTDKSKFHINMMSREVTACLMKIIQ
jgi:type I restriction enzyme S subunit